MALAGSLTGLLVAWSTGAAEPAIRAGAFGFNSALAAIAFGGVFFVLNRVSIAYGLLATIATVIVFAAVSAAMAFPVRGSGLFQASACARAFTPRYRQCAAAHRCWREGDANVSAT